MKFIRLVWKSVGLLYRRNHTAFIIFIAVMVTVSLGFVFFFTTTFTARQNFLRQRDGMRTIEASQEQPPQKADAMALPEKLSKNPVIALDNIRYTFSFHMDKNSGPAPSNELVAYWKPEKSRENDNTVGKNITAQEIADEAPVLVGGNMSSPGSKPILHKTGSTEKVGGVSLKVIGTYSSSDSYGMIPYTVGLRHYTLQGVQLVVPASASDNQKEQLGQYLQTLLPGSRVTVPQPLKQEALGSMLISYLAGFVIGVSALVSLLFIFKYMLESSRRDYFVYQVCGCGGRKLFCVLLCELFFLFTLCFAAGTLLLAVLRLIYRTNIVFAGSSMQAADVLLIYLLSLLMILVIMVPYLLHYRKQAVNGGGEV